MKKFTTLQEDLRNWFDPKHPEGGWKRVNSKGEAIGPCAREPGEAKPKCMSNEKRAALSKKERAAAVRSKRKHDPNPERKGKPINVSNFGKGKLSESMEQLDEKNVPTNPELWSKAKSLAKSKFDVYPSAYANGWAAKWYKSKGGGWKSVNEETEQIGEQHREKGRFKPVKPHNVPETPGAMLRKEQNDTQEKVEMTQSQLHFIGYACDEILDYIDMGGEVEEWYQVKVAKAFSEFESLHAYIEGEKRRTGMVKESYKSPEPKLKPHKSPVAAEPKVKPHKSPIGSEKYINKHLEKRLAKEETQLDEISAETKAAYTLKAKQQVKELEPHTKKGEYMDLAKNLIAKRKKGLAMAKEETINEDDLPKTSGKQKTVTVKHKTSGKELNVVDTPSVREKYKKMDYHPVKEEAEQIEEAEKIQKHRPGWMARMIKRDNPEMAAKMNQGKEMNKLMHKYGGKTSDEIAKMKKEATEVPFEGGKPAKGTVTDKSGAKHTPMSRAKDLARKALERQKQAMKPVKESESESRKKQIVKDAAKNASKKAKDNFDPNPELSSEIIKQ